MNVAIVCELNPFHIGHSRIFRAARVLSELPRERIKGKVISTETVDAILEDHEKSHCAGEEQAAANVPAQATANVPAQATASAPERGLVFAVMSGNFSQRGDPTLLDKWTRARIAVKQAADAVFEIPSVYSAASAQFFADAAVDIVEGLGCVDVLLFGSECGDGRLLSEAARKRLSAYDGEGLLKVGGDAEESFPKALERLLGVRLSGNDILAVEYLCALERRKSKTVPGIFRIRQEEADGSADYLFHASDVRKLWSTVAELVPEQGWEHDEMRETIKKMLSRFKTYMPPEAYEIFEEKMSSGEFTADIETLENVILAEFRRMTPLEADGLPFAEDGLGRKIHGECLKTGSISRVISKATGKAFTESRVKRTLISVITGAEQDMYPSMIFVPYIRMLAVRRSVNISALVASVSTACEAGGRRRDVILGNVPGNYENAFSEETVRLLRKEILASDLYALGVKVRKHRDARKEFTVGLISL